MSGAPPQNFTEARHARPQRHSRRKNSWRPEYAVIFYAAALPGGVCTTAGALYTAGELNRQLNDCSARYLLTTPQLIDKAAGAVKDTLVREVFVLGYAPGATPFSALPREAGPAPEVSAGLLEDVVSLPYSSGIGGLPKGVMLTHYNLTSNLCQVDAARFVTPQDVVAGVLPFSHIYGLHAIMNVRGRRSWASIFPSQSSPAPICRSCQVLRRPCLSSTPKWLTRRSFHSSSS